MSSRRQKFRQSWELFQNLTQRELKGKYKRTVFGQLWSLANPIALMIVYTFVFSFIFRVGVPVGESSGLDSFPLWLLCGLLPWIFFSTVVSQGMGSLIANEPLIRKVYFPRGILIYSTVAALAVNWGIEMVVLLIALSLAGAIGSLIFLPLVAVVMILLVIFAAGIALMLSIANVYFRDSQYLVSIALQLGMYLTPVIYPISLVAAQSDRVGPVLGDITLLDIYKLNPMEHFLAALRQMLYDGVLPAWGDLLFCLAVSLLSLALGILVFAKHERKLAEIL